MNILLWDLHVRVVVVAHNSILFKVLKVCKQLNEIEK